MTDRPEGSRAGIGWFFLRRILSLFEIAVLLAAFGTLMKFFAGIWWFADLWSHFTVQYAVILTVGIFALIAMGKKKTFGVIFPLWIFNIGQLAFVCWIPAAPPIAEPAGEPLRLVTFNVLTGNSNYAGVRKWLEDSDADVIGLLEISRTWKEELKPLSEKYPHIFFQPRMDNFGIGIMSRIPIENVEVIHFPPAAIPTLDIDFGDFRLLLTHPIPPMTGKRAEERDQQLAKVGEKVLSTEIPTLLAGDFKQTPWSPRFRKLLKETGLRNAASGQGLAPTWHIFPGFMGGVVIDHVLHTPGITVLERDVGPYLGSDHRPVVVDFLLPEN